MTDIGILAIDLTKHSFQDCATTADGVVIYNRKYTGGKTKLGRVSKMGQSDLGRLLIKGATVCIRCARWKGIKQDSWLGKRLQRKQRTFAAAALAKKDGTGFVGYGHEEARLPRWFGRICLTPHRSTERQRKLIGFGKEGDQRRLWVAGSADPPRENNLWVTGDESPKDRFGPEVIEHHNGPWQFRATSDEA